MSQLKSNRIELDYFFCKKASVKLLRHAFANCILQMSKPGTASLTIKRDVQQMNDNYFEYNSTIGCVEFHIY